MTRNGAAVVLFDGVCTLCNGAVDFLIRHDRHLRLRYASLQSRAAETLLAQMGATPANLDSILLVDNHQVYERSTAALQIAGYLPWPWSWLKLLLLIPRPLRDGVYNWIARNRYRWFGTRDTCRLPTADERDRFLDQAEITSNR